MTSSVRYSRKREPSIRERVVRMVRDDIARGAIGYDTRLVDHEIAASLDVSRMPVREALMQLRSEGMLESTPRGFVLKVHTPEEIGDIFDVRMLLEPAAAAGACEQRTEAGLARMQAAVAEVADAHEAGDIRRGMQANWQFRSAWVGMVPNASLVDTMQRLRDCAEQSRLAALGDAAFRRGTLDRARGILEAFIAGDAALVARRIEDNLRICRDAYCARQAELLAGEPTEASSPRSASPPTAS